MKYAMMDMIEASPAFKEATTVINEVVNEANRRKIKLTEEQRNSLREFRILATIAKDERVRRAVSDEVYDLLQERAGNGKANT